MGKETPFKPNFTKKRESSSLWSDKPTEKWSKLREIIEAVPPTKANTIKFNRSI
jgi:hypothetical protein